MLPCLGCHSSGFCLAAAARDASSSVDLAVALSTLSHYCVVYAELMDFCCIALRVAAQCQHGESLGKGSNACSEVDDGSLDLLLGCTLTHVTR